MTRDFRLYWIGQTTSRFGSSITTVALPLVAISVLRASTFQVAVLAAAVWLPWLLAGLPAGVWVDRSRSRRHIMIVCDLVAAALFVSVPVAAWLGVLAIGHLLVVALLTGLVSVFFETAGQIYLAELLPPQELTTGNARLVGADAAAKVAGPGVGGLIAQLFGAVAGVLADALTFVVSAACMLAVRHREPALRPPVAAASGPPRATASGLPVTTVSGPPVTAASRPPVMAASGQLAATTSGKAAATTPGPPLATTFGPASAITSRQAATATSGPPAATTVGRPGTRAGGHPATPVPGQHDDRHDGGHDGRHDGGHGDTAASDRPAKDRGVAAVAEGLRFVAGDPFLRVMTVFGAACNLALNGYHAILVLFLVRELGADPGVVGLLMAGVSVGGIAGAALAGRVARRIGTARAMIAVHLCTAPFALLVPLATPGPGLALMVVGGVVVTTGIVADNVIKGAFRQAYVPRHLLGRVVNSMQLLNYGAIPVGALLGGVLGTALGLRPTMWIMTAAIVASNGLLLIGPLKRRRDLPTAPAGSRLTLA